MDWDLAAGTVRLQLMGRSEAPDPDYRYQIVSSAQGVVGEIHLRIGNARTLCYEGNIGYYILPAYRGRGYATEACRKVALEAGRLGVTRLIITTDPANLPSRRVCQKLGAVLLEEVRVPRSSPLYRQGERKKCRYMWAVP